jgi:hypothetical protein
MATKVPFFVSTQTVKNQALFVKKALPIEINAVFSTKLAKKCHGQNWITSSTKIPTLAQLSSTNSLKKWRHFSATSSGKLRKNI